MLVRSRLALGDGVTMQVTVRSKDETSVDVIPGFRGLRVPAQQFLEFPLFLAVLLHVVFIPQFGKDFV